MLAGFAVPRGLRDSILLRRATKIIRSDLERSVEQYHDRNPANLSQHGGFTC